MSNFEKVGKFMKTFGQEVKNKAKFPDEKTVKLRYDLIAEELAELDPLAYLFREDLSRKQRRQQLGDFHTQQEQLSREDHSF